MALSALAVSRQQLLSPRQPPRAAFAYGQVSSVSRVCDERNFVYDWVSLGPGASGMLWAGRKSSPLGCCLECAGREPCRAWFWSLARVCQLGRRVAAPHANTAVQGVEHSRGAVSGLARKDSSSTAGNLSPVQPREAQPGITLAIHADVSRLETMVQTREFWNASVAIAVLVLSAQDLATAERVLHAAGRAGPPLRWCAYRPPILNERSPIWTCELPCT